MKITPFNPKDTALVLIDHQIGTMQLIKTIDLKHVEKMTLALAKVAKIFNMPVVLTSSQEDRVQGSLIPELQKILPEAYEKRIQRAGIVNAWSDPAFKKAVEETGKRNLTIIYLTQGIYHGLCCTRSITSCKRFSLSLSIENVWSVAAWPVTLTGSINPSRWKRIRSD